MSLIVEVNEDGALQLPDEVLEAIKPNSRFVVEIQNKTVVLSPVEETKPFWETATPEERIKRWREWGRSHKESPNLPSEALRRENMYD